MDLIKEIVIVNPPAKWTLVYKKAKFDSKGKEVTHQDFYLTGNLFYSDRTSFHLTSKIIQESKEFLYGYLRGLPQLEKMIGYYIKNKFKVFCSLFIIPYILNIILWSALTNL